MIKQDDKWFVKRLIKAQEPVKKRKKKGNFGTLPRTIDNPVMDGPVMVNSEPGTIGVTPQM